MVAGPGGGALHRGRAWRGARGGENPQQLTSRGRRPAALLAIASLTLGACGGGSSTPPRIEDRADPSALAARFTALTGVRLVRADGPHETTLGPAASASDTGHFGPFTMYVAKDADRLVALERDEEDEPARQGRDGLLHVADGLQALPPGHGVLATGSLAGVTGDPRGPELRRALEAAAGPASWSTPTRRSRSAPCALAWSACGRPG